MEVRKEDINGIQKKYYQLSWIKYIMDNLFPNNKGWNINIQKIYSIKTNTYECTFYEALPRLIFNVDDAMRNF